MESCLPTPLQGEEFPTGARSVPLCQQEVPGPRFKFSTARLPLLSGWREVGWGVLSFRNRYGGELSFGQPPTAYDLWEGLYE